MRHVDWFLPLAPVEESVKINVEAALAAAAAHIIATGLLGMCHTFQECVHLSLRHLPFFHAVEMPEEVINVFFLEVQCLPGLSHGSYYQGFDFFAVKLRSWVSLLNVPHFIHPLLDVIGVSTDTDAVLNAFSAGLDFVFVVQLGQSYGKVPINIDSYALA